jgi:hypothetical protein
VTLARSDVAVHLADGAQARQPSLRPTCVSPGANCRLPAETGLCRGPGWNLVAVGAPVPGARHDVYAWQAGGLAERLTGMHLLADLGYVGTGMLTGNKTPPSSELTDNQKQVNTDLSGLRAAVERAISHLKNWKILSGRYQGPLDKFPSVVRTVVALAFFKSYY